MRLRCAILFSLCSVFVFGAILLFSKSFSVCKADCQDERCSNPPCCNGDVNGDGAVDLGDAIFLLSYLFAGGSEPLRIDCALPATGQTHCYDAVGQPIGCATRDYPGQDGFYVMGCSSEGRFVDNGDGTVTDLCTGLMWQKATPLPPGPVGVSAETGFTWQEALRYCDSLCLCKDGAWITNSADSVSHGGIKYDDWRLPNIRELQSIVDYGRMAPAADPIFGAEPDWYWSATSDTADPVGAWAVDFFHGSVEDNATKGIYRNVRAVRNAW